MELLLVLACLLATSMEDTIYFSIIHPIMFVEPAIHLVLLALHKELLLANRVVNQ